MKQLTKLQNTIYALGAVLILLGAVLWMTKSMVAIYIYCLGSVLFAAMQFLQSYEGNNVTVKRLRRQQILGALLLMLTGVLMIVNTMHLGYLYHNEWIVCMSIAAFLELYTAFRIPAALKDDEKNSF